MTDRSTRAGIMSECDLMIANATVVSVNDRREVFAPGAVAIRGNKIAAVGPERDVVTAWHAHEVIDARGAPVHPGYIDPHIHIVHGTCRGVLEDATTASGESVNFAEWKSDVTSDDEHAACALGALELLQNGFTTFVEPGTLFDTGAAAQAVNALGVRALFAGCYLWDQVELMHHLGSLESQSLYRRAPPQTRRCLDELGAELHRNSDPDALVRGYVSVYGLGTASDEVLLAGKAIADENGVAFHQHENYTPASSQADYDRLGRSRIAHLSDLGVLGANATLIHMNVVRDEEIDPICSSGLSIIWCPFAYLDMGISAETRCRIPELHEMGVNVCIATDGARESVAGDSAMAAYMVSRNARDPVTAADLIAMQTINAARAAGIDDWTGSIECGKRADIVVRNEHAAQAWPGTNVVHQLAFQHRGSTVDTVIVDGRVVLRGGRSTRIDEEEVHIDARDSVARRLRRLGLSGRIAWPVVSV